MIEQPLVVTTESLVEDIGPPPLTLLHVSHVYKQCYMLCQVCLSHAMMEIYN